MTGPATGAHAGMVGWRWAPVEPDKRMVKRGRMEIGGGSTFNQGEREEMAAEIYRAMLAAAPEATQPVQAEGMNQLVSELRARANARHTGEMSETAKLCARAADALEALCAVAARDGEVIP